MNREVKFRAWDEVYKEMYEVLMINFQNRKVGVKTRDISTAFMDGSIPYTQKLKNIADLTLLEFTGLYDRDGREIYEGDILGKDSFIDGPVEYHPPCFLVRTNYFSYTFNEDDLIGIYDDYCIIGNVYENPELLKEA